MLAGHSGPDAVEEIWALWPSASVARFAEALDLSEKLPGCGFFSQGGGELVNNKAVLPTASARTGPCCGGPDR